VFYCCFFFLGRDFRAPSADRPETLPHDLMWAQFYNTGGKIRGRPPGQKKLGPKTCKIRRYFGQLQTSIANMYRMEGDIQCDRQRFLPRLAKNSGELWRCDAQLNALFRKTIFRRLSGAAPLNFCTR